MNASLAAISTGLTAFTATNLDDILILLLFFSQVNGVFRHRHIVAGQYLGFGGLVLASLPGFFGSQLLPPSWIGLLGLLPIAIGMSRLFDPDEDEAIADGEIPLTGDSWFPSSISPQTCSVAAITLANGGDNVGIYVPLFANSAGSELAVILGVFFSLVGVWCYTAYRLTQLPAIAEILARYGDRLVPFVLIGLGISILLDSHTLENRSLATLALAISGLILIALLRDRERIASVEVQGKEI
jgi:cadmium resistance transport/sequestration family protein